MRIKGYGMSSGGFGDGNRSESFKKRHRIGQKIRGTVIKNIANGMAWVDLNGDRLLAQVATSHREGSTLFFQITALHPKIMLKELTDGHSGSSAPLGLATTFDTARILFEKQFKPEQRSLSQKNFFLQRNEFLHILTGNKELYTRYMDAVRCASTISTTLEPTGRGQVFYQPWLAPLCHRQVTVITQPKQSTSLRKILVEFDHAKMGMVCIEFLLKTPTLACTLKMQRPQHGAALKRYLSSKTYGGSTLKLHNISVAKLPQNAHGGIITALLFHS
ncbi:hypothetical protein GO013_14355 [Pseudodesulfovibrio sp. JC047]|uniref:hypothetical protein n=1 Tax=Pseudodesulfovibrio sp. JC047 TaxID=2683199 RepID=UPI0013D0B100|nr:hypothetical protein [Pseudodesulfovibrio sp. JC047]NDV20590.1 hypothetical protein [Pseudodesulfovibrio sp. JC047]